MKGWEAPYAVCTEIEVLQDTVRFEKVVYPFSA